MEQEQQELMFKLAMYEQQIRQFQQQLQAIEEGIIDMQTLNLELDELKGSNGKEILAQIGKGIFVRSKIISEDLVVGIGSKNFVKKNITETKKTISEQIEKLEDIKKELNVGLEKISEEITKTINETENTKNK